jgi:prefoldin subunit 5
MSAPSSASAPFSPRLAQYGLLIAATMAPLQRARSAELQRAAASLAALHARAEALAALCAHAAAAPSPPAAAAGEPYTPLFDLGLGVCIAGAVDCSEDVLVDVGAGVHVAMAPREALLFCRRAAAEARSQHALAEKALRDVSADLAGACGSYLQLQRLEEAEAQQAGGKRA